jgi:hypothetical protein
MKTKIACDCGKTHTITLREHQTESSIQCDCGKFHRVVNQGIPSEMENELEQEKARVRQIHVCLLSPNYVDEINRFLERIGDRFIDWKLLPAEENEYPHVVFLY